MMELVSISMVLHEKYISYPEDKDDNHDSVWTSLFSATSATVSKSTGYLTMKTSQLLHTSKCVSNNIGLPLGGLLVVVDVVVGVVLVVVGRVC